MAFIYAADLWCDSCGCAIRKQLRRKRKSSSDYPEFVGDPGESDCPQHCGSDEDCLEAIELQSGRKIGALLSTDLTEEGVRYTKKAIAAGGEVADLWAEEFSHYL